MPIDDSNDPRYYVQDEKGNVLDPYTADYGEAVGVARHHAWRTKVPTAAYRWVKRGRYFEGQAVWRSWVEGRAIRPDGTIVGYH